MLYTPILPEAASGTLEPRHVVVPLRQMCPHAELLLGHARALDEAARTVEVETETGSFAVAYERLVLALGAVPRTFPVSGLARHGLGFKDLADAIQLRNHVLRQREHVFALGDCAAVPNARTPGRTDPHLPPLSAAARLAQAARRHRLDDLPLLPARHRRALRARPPAPARGGARVDPARAAACLAGILGLAVWAFVRRATLRACAGPAREPACRRARVRRGLRGGRPGRARRPS